jgi:DNA-binding beta-propeller fold protein YncE/TolB-like protein
MRSRIPVLVFFVLSGSFLWAGGMQEASVDRGEYLAGKGIIIPAEEIFEDSYVSAVDYRYPDPDSSFGVRFYAGHRQLSMQGQEEIFLIAVQGRRPTFEDLPVMNHVFVIDKSGSMYQKDKMSWVKESFDAFMNTIRSKDFVSLVVFDDTARTVFPSTRMESVYTRRRFSEAVHSLVPGGGSNVQSALQLAYREILSNYHEDYVNRVLLLTDGVGNVEQTFGIADVYREIGVNVTTIGMGESCDFNFLRDLADRAGGSARFLSSREKIQEIFGKDFIRMVIPAARNIELDLHLLENLQNVKTWGYHSRIEGLWDWYEQSGDGVPSGLAADAWGNVYVADEASNRVQKFTLEGTLLTQWGRTGRRDWDPGEDKQADAMEGKFFHPRGIAADARGSVYVADSGNDRIQKFDANGRFLLQWGGPGSSRGKFRQPTDVAVDGQGYVYVTDPGNHRIQKFDPNGNFVTEWGEHGTAEGQFETPVAVAVGPYRNIYVADVANRRVQIFESDGTLIMMLDSKQASVSPVGIVVDRSGNIYIADQEGGKVWKFGMDGAYITAWGSFGEEDRAFGELTAIAVDKDGNILVADSAHRRIQKFDPTGNFMIRQPLKFFIPTINLGDYETIVIQATIPKQDKEGLTKIARLTGTYTDINGDPVVMDPVTFSVKFVPVVEPVTGFSNATVLRAATILHYAQALKEIGSSYYGGRIEEALEVAHEAKNELWNAQLRLGDQSLADEISILERYISIMSAEAELTEAETQQMAESTEMKPAVQDRTLDEHLDSLFAELLLELRSCRPGSVAVTGFSFQDLRSAKLLEVLNGKAESALVVLTSQPGFSVVAAGVLQQVLEEDSIDRSDLIDTNTAIEVGQRANARYIITGTVIELKESVAVFCRVVDVRSAAIVSVSQVIVPKSSEISALL